jgi:DNA-binding HxlR family transcriptional regulator
MKTYGQFCPIAIAAEIFAERWTPLIVRELFAGSTRFSELERGLPRIPKSVLAQRLRALEAAGVIERHDTSAKGRGARYRLTRAGRELAEIVLLLGDWGKQWAKVEIGPHNVDPDFLFWDMHRRIRLDRLPDRRVVVRFDLTGTCQRSYWLLLERPEPSMCVTDPGFEVDLLVTADTVALHRVWVGDADLATALRKGLIVIDGPAALRRAFPEWLALSIYMERGNRLSALVDAGHPVRLAS